ncbi:MAG: hypothetical protein HXS54_02685 [Theionarchaea archaeon]|nr:hypothetical protein [Theionarchaea archaeon]
MEPPSILEKQCQVQRARPPLKTFPTYGVLSGSFLQEKAWWSFVNLHFL